MSNRAAFIDFAQGLLNLNPLERWTPAQAKLHPFITQAKFTGPFVPPMTLKSGSSRSPAPGVQEQQRYEGMSRQRQQQQQQAVAQQQQAQAAQHAAYANMQMNQYAGSAKSLQHVPSKPSGRPSALPCSSSTIWPADEYDAATTAAAVQPASEPVCPSYDPRRTATSNHDGSAAVGTIRDPTRAPEGHESSGSKCARPFATVTSILPAAA